MDNEDEEISDEEIEWVGETWKFQEQQGLLTNWDEEECAELTDNAIRGLVGAKDSKQTIEKNGP